jgi:hypothetical protein
MLTICTWLWGDKYGPADVAKLHAGLRRHLVQPFRLICCTDQGEGEPEELNGPDGPITLYFIEQADTHLLTRRGCFARLRMFDPEWQAAHGLAEGDRLVCIDLDVVVTGALDVLFNRPEPFLILQKANSANPCPYNGSIWMLRAGYRPDVWADFSLEAAAKVPFHEFPDDQAWMAHKLPGEGGWQAGARSGVYAFKKPGWPASDDLPKDARLVCFPGHRDPSQFTHLPWIQEHWRA